MRGYKQGKPFFLGGGENLSDKMYVSKLTETV